jgi:ABC-2 type transport system permease protein
MARGDSPAGPPARRDFHGPLLELTLARLREFVRDPSALFWTFGFPILLAIALGIAFRESPPAPVKVAVDEAAVGSRDLVSLLDARDDIDASWLSVADARRGLATGKLDLLVTAGGGEEDWVYHYDAMRPEAKTARLAVDDVVETAGGREDRVATRDVIEREPGGRYIDFLVPGLVGLNIMGSAIWGIGFAVVDARKRKMLKRLAATPMSRAHFLLSFMLSRLLFLALEVVALLGFGWLVFDVPVRGSALGLAVVSLWGALSLTGIAMLIASRPRSVETQRRDGLGPREPLHAPDVAARGLVLQLRAVSGHVAAVHPCATTDGAERRAAQDRERRPRPARRPPRARLAGPVGRPELRDRAEVLPLAIAVRSVGGSYASGKRALVRRRRASPFAARRWDSSRSGRNG